MRLRILIFFIVLISIGQIASKALAQTNSNCPEITVHVDPSKNGNVGRIELSFKSDVRINDYSVNLFAPHANDNQLDAKTTNFENLKAGRYYIIVQSRQTDCIKQITVDVK